MSNTFLTRQQRYAQAVYDRIKPFINKDETTRKKYGSLAHKLPVLIRTGGLAQSLAFVEARNNEDTPQRQLLGDLEHVIREIGILKADQNLFTQSRTVDFEQYMRLTEAALEALLWFKRFAQSELKVEQGDEASEEPHAS